MFLAEGILDERCASVWSPKEIVAMERDGPAFQIQPGCGCCAREFGNAWLQPALGWGQACWIA
jgi:hypothetical protein